MNQDLAVEVQRDRCPFCHDAVSPEQDKTACDACMAWHHKECWSNHGGCSACGEGAPTQTKPSPKAGAAAQRVVRAVRPAEEGEVRPRRAWLDKAGFVVSLITALLGFSLLAASYSPTETTSGIWAINFTTPKGFSGLGVAFTLLVTAPLLILGAGFSFAGRQPGKPLANAGLAISGVYGLALAIASAMAFG